MAVFFAETLEVTLAVTPVCERGTRVVSGGQRRGSGSMAGDTGFRSPGIKRRFTNQRPRRACGVGFWCERFGIRRRG
jgi:hypothetical protein